MHAGIKAMNTEKQMDWDLTSYFPSFDGPEYRAHRDALEQALPKFGEKAASLGALSGENMDQMGQMGQWEALLLERERLIEDYSHLSSYIGCLNAADSRNESYKREQGRLAKMGAAFRKATIPILVALKNASEDVMNALISRESLKTCRYHMVRLQWEARHSMDPALENLTADLGVDGYSAWGRLYNEVSGRLEFEMRWPDGRVERIPMSQRISLMRDADPEVRKAALLGSNQAWSQVEHIAAACLNSISGTRTTLYPRRGIGHFLEMAVFDAGVRRETIETMWQVVEKNRETVYRYLRRKAEVIGKPKLGIQDISCPLPMKADDRYRWQEGADLVIDSFRRFYPNLGEFAQSMLDRNFIDWQKRPGKRPGAFCTTSLKTRESRVFMTYGGAVGDVQTLAHELGHAFHSWIIRDMRAYACDYPMTLAEAASTFAESVLSRAIVESENTSDALRVQVLTSRLDNAAVFLLDIHMRYLFEKRFYEERSRGEVGILRLKTLMLEAQRECFGDILAEDEMDPMFWASKLHFYITGVTFYNFPYTFGYLLSTGLLARAKSDGASFFTRYEKLLRLTGSYPAEEVVKRAIGADLTQPAFWQEAIDSIAEEVAEFEKRVQA
ncbi:MAG: M3 family oligoendopeptidase [Desulfobacteraceae bacterium]|nr:MAG: M3 family oligoendopeptidase [Desulfobacteraceae bacterium]